MKPLLALVAALMALASSTAKAASLSATTFSFISSNSRAFALYLDGSAVGGGQNLNGQFDSISLSVVPLFAGTTFTNQNSGVFAGAPRPAGQAFTYRNRYLESSVDDPENPGTGWIVTNVVSTTTMFGFDGGPLGQKITTANEPGGKLFLANLHMPRVPGTFSYINATVKLYNGAALVTTAILAAPDPEPATIVMVAQCGFGIAIHCRRRWWTRFAPSPL